MAKENIKVERINDITNVYNGNRGFFDSSTSRKKNYYLKEIEDKDSCFFAIYVSCENVNFNAKDLAEKVAKSVNSIGFYPDNKNITFYVQLKKNLEEVLKKVTKKIGEDSKRALPLFAAEVKKVNKFAIGASSYSIVQLLASNLFGIVKIPQTSSIELPLEILIHDSIMFVLIMPEDK
ncbi:29061_t:CDS:2 [Gigaspora margarita]|uniref:29061_t:CDS:1 n=1 Tax=Gigaspora margarita TaxID=4874 RepID=A0ABM8VVT7_GIGMA|nr:29061_t:CDS:2 [Gigaspora margarita]